MPCIFRNNAAELYSWFKALFPVHKAWGRRRRRKRRWRRRKRTRRRRRRRRSEHAVFSSNAAELHSSKAVVFFQ